MQEVAESDILSDGSKMIADDSFHSQEHNLPLEHNQPQKDGLNFITLGNLSEAERIKIIQKGFQLNQDGKISLKKYYEGTDQYSLFVSKGYQIKYETIRRTKLYQQWKEYTSLNS